MSHDVILFCQRLGAIRWHAISNAGKLTKSEAMFKTVGSRNRSVISGPQTSANTCVQRRVGRIEILVCDSYNLYGCTIYRHELNNLSKRFLDQQRLE